MFLQVGLLITVYNDVSFSFLYAAIAFLIHNCFIHQAGNLENSLGTSANVIEVLSYVMHAWLQGNKDTLKM